MSARMFTPAATAAAAITVLLFTTSLRSSSTGPMPAVQRIDRIIGGGGFNVVMPVRSGPGQIARITARLAYIESLLKSRDVSTWPAALRAERARNIERLHEYRLRGIYPRNEADPGKLLPCFIDGHGAICAVGYLVEQSAGRDVAEWINRRYQYATVAEMDSPVLAAWIARSGLTKAEVMTIQEPGWNDLSESTTGPGWCKHVDKYGLRKALPIITWSFWTLFTEVPVPIPAAKGMLHTTAVGITIRQAPETATTLPAMESLADDRR